MTTLEPTYEMQLLHFMETGNRTAVECALETENSLKFYGMDYSQSLIDCCTNWLSAEGLKMKARLQCAS